MNNETLLLKAVVLILQNVTIREHVSRTSEEQRIIDEINARIH